MGIVSGLNYTTSPKCRLDVWKPRLRNADGTVIQNAKWVQCETFEHLASNQRRRNALNYVDMTDVIYNPRKVSLTVANRPMDFTTPYDNTNSTTRANTVYEYVYHDSDGDAAHSSVIKIPKNVGLFATFFFEFQHVRVVDLQTHLVLFTGRIYNIDSRYEGSTGAIIKLECRDALEELRSISCKNMAKDLQFTYNSSNPWRRSDFVQTGLNLGLNYLAAGAKPPGGPEKSQRSPTNSPLTGAFTINSDDRATTAAANSYVRYERSATSVGETLVWRLSNSGAKSILDEMIRFAIAEPHEDETADDQFGYDMFVDSNIGSANLDPATPPPAAMFNYYKRGNRLALVGTQTDPPTLQEPNKYGLKVILPTRVSNIDSDVGHQTSSAGTTYATRLMEGRSFTFGNPKSDLYTEAILTYEGSEDAAEEGELKAYSRKVVRDKKFEVIWVNHVNGQFTYKGKNIDDEWKKDSNSSPGVDSAEVLDAYNAAGTTLKSGGVARIQYQSNAGNATTTSDFTYVLLSDIDTLGGTFPAANYDSEAYVTLKGATSGRTCRFNAEATAPQEGRPAKVWGIRKSFARTQMNISRPDELRLDIASRLAQASANIRRGTYQFSHAAYYWVDFKIMSIASTGGAGQRLTVKHINGSSSIPVTTYGFRAGMLVHKMTTDFGGIAQANSNDVYGYCFNMENDSTFDVDLTESATFAANDFVRLFVPVRAGDIIRVDCAPGDTFGNHLITNLNFTESMGPITQIESLGKNEVRKGGVGKKTIWNTVYRTDKDEEQNTTRNIPKSTQMATFSGTFTEPAANRIEWTAGNLITSDGTTYQIVASGTGTTSGTSDATYGLGSSGMVGTNRYLLYVDPEGENPTTNAYHIKTIIETAYKQDSDNIVMRRANAGTVKPSSSGVQVPGDAKSEATDIIHNETMTTALLKKGARAWTTDLQIDGTAFNAISWSAATLTFANGDTVTISAGNHTSIAPGTHYMYINGVSGSLTPLLTTTHGTAIGDAKILLATVTVSAATDGDKPTIFPFNGKKPTLSAVVLAADLIIADHIRTGTISADRFTSAAQSSITEKTKTHVGGSAPSSPRTNDIWFDTGLDPVVIKVYDGSSWVIQNQNESGGARIFSNPIGTPPTTTNSGSSNIPSENVARYDLWMTSDTNQLYQALHATSNTIIATGQWTLKDDADAINRASTSINGGLIKTQRIKLLDGGSLNTVANAFETTVSAPIDTGRNTAASIGSATAGDVTENITIEAHGGGSDLQIYAGDVVRVGTTSTYEDMYVQSGSATTMTVVRGWNSTTTRTFSSGSDIKRYNYSVTALTNPHIILDNHGITGYSNAYTPEFSLSSETGKGTFAEGKITLGQLGIAFDHKGQGAANSISWAHADANGDAISGAYNYTWLYRANAGSTSDTVASNGKHLILLGNNYNDPAGCALISYVDFGIDADTHRVPHIYAENFSGGCITDSYTGSSSTTAASRTALVTGLANHAHSYASTGHGHSGYSSTGHGHSYDNYVSWRYRTDTASYEDVVSNEAVSIRGSDDIGVTHSGGTITIEYTGSSGSSHTHSSSLDIAADDITCDTVTLTGKLESSSTSVRFWNLNDNNATYEVRMGDGGYLYQYSSSRRFKENIIDLDFDSSKIYDLLPHTFKWKDAEREGIPVIGKTDFGYIAEEVHEILPHLVGYDNFEDGDNLPASVHYNQITVLLVEEMKKLKARIEVLEGN